MLHSVAENIGYGQKAHTNVEVLLVFICKRNSMLSDLPGVASGYVADEGVACYGA
jgi:hypothetical protein